MVPARPLLFALLAVSSPLCRAETPTPPPETHEFHVKGEVNYRCYAGYSGKTVTDEKTHAVCDNKTYKGVVVDKVIPIKIQFEPNPDDVKDLNGSWDEKFEFKGRKFEIAVDLFKLAEKSARPYRLTLVASDDEPSPRRTNLAADFASVKEMNSLSSLVSSVGKKEEISFTVSIEPAAKK